MVISVDIGTSYCSGCLLMPDGTVRPIEIGTGASMFGSRYAMPSAIYVQEDGSVLLGQAAMNSRKRNPQNFRMEFKRDFGSSVPILLGPRSFLPEDIYTELLRHVGTCAEAVTSEKIGEIYLTCPASYGRAKREKLCSAAERAGFLQVKLVEEPVAAAMCCCEEGYIHDGEQFLIYDFGGGTFDVSLIRWENGRFELLAEPEGLEQCGGIDMNRLIYQDILNKLREDMPDVLDALREHSQQYMRFTSLLSELAVKCKHHLSSAAVFSDELELSFDRMFTYRLTVEQFNQMIAPLVGETVQACRSGLECAGLRIADLSGILLVGGTSRIPLVRTMVEQFAGAIPVYHAPDQELTVARGALTSDLIQLRQKLYVRQQQNRETQEENERRRIEMEERRRMEQEERRRREEEEYRRKEALEQQKKLELQRQAEEERRKQEEIEREEARRRQEREERERRKRLLQLEVPCRMNRKQGTLRLFSEKIVFVPKKGGGQREISCYDVIDCTYTSAMLGRRKWRCLLVGTMFLCCGGLCILDPDLVFLWTAVLVILTMWSLRITQPMVRITSSNDGKKGLFVRKQHDTIRKIKKMDRLPLLQNLEENLLCTVHRRDRFY